MNYGKENAARQAAQLRKRGRKKHSPGLALLRIMLICVVAGALAIGIFGYTYAKNLIDQLPDVSTIDISPTGYLSTVYDSDGNEIETLAKAGANRTYVTLDEIPTDLQHAFVAIEDERFYEHNGIDLQGIIRAAVKGVLNGFDFSEGASTITQQLLKNNYFTTWTSEDSFLSSLNRKIQEQYLAVQLEKITSKDVILENYLNSINLGQNTLGVQSAANRYFNKDVKDLSLSECSVIAAITQNPSKYNPISHPEENAVRRKKVLTNMLNQGYITESAYNEAINDDVYDRIAVVNTDYTTTSTSYFVDALTDEVIEDLQTRLGYTSNEAYTLLYSGGLDIYSTQDTSIQTIVEDEINNLDNYSGLEKISFSYRLTLTKADGSTANYSETTMLSYYQSSNSSYNLEFDSEEEAQAAIDAYKEAIMEDGDEIEGENVTFTVQPQAAMTVMDQSTGQVVALVGGRGEKNASKTLNRATGITRQPGSTFKIIGCFAAALDAGGKTLASVEDDHPTTYADGTSLSNYDKHYRGYTNIRTAITHSINVVTVETMADIGTSLGFKYAKDLGISTLVDGDNNQAMALGGITNGVTNLDLTAAYATIANGGAYNKPIFYTVIKDHQGNIILDNRENESTQVLKETTAWLLTSAMKDVMTKGTGTKAAFSGMTIAGKSGTTTKNRDTVFAGYTPYYTAVIWGGYDDNTPQSSTSYSKTVWKAVMSRIHENLADKDFTQPSGIVTASVCAKSGKLAIASVCDCDPRGSQVYTEYFEEGTQPTEYCDKHYKGNVCTQTHMLATSGCPALYGSFIIGGSAGTDDEAYSINAETFGQYCPLHGGDPLANDTSSVGHSQTADPSVSVDVSGGSTGTTTDTTTDTTTGTTDTTTPQQ